MANRIKIRRGSGKPSSSNILPYELGWDTSNKVLYINNNDSSIEPIADGFLKIYGTAFVSSDNVDNASYGLYYSASSTRSSELTGTVPYTTGFRFFSFRNYSTDYNF